MMSQITRVMGSVKLHSLCFVSNSCEMMFEITRVMGSLNSHKLRIDRSIIKGEKRVYCIGHT